MLSTFKVRCARLSTQSNSPDDKKRKEKGFEWAQHQMLHRFDRDHMGEAGIDSFQERVSKRPSCQKNREIVVWDGIKSFSERHHCQPMNS